MTREEQIIEAGTYHLYGSRPPKTCGHNMHELAYISRNLAFEAGAKWADEHPDSNHTYTKQQLIDMGFAFTTNGDIVTPEQSNEDLKKYLQYQKRKFIEEACDWLVMNASDMKVKEFIGHLQTLDQDRDIHIVYDGYYVFDPEVSIADDDWDLDDKTFKYRKGDYLIQAG